METNGNAGSDFRRELCDIVRKNIQRHLLQEEDDEKWFEYEQNTITEYVKIRAKLSQQYHFWLISTEKEVRAQLIVNHLTNLGICAYYEYHETKRIYSVYVNLAIEMALAQ